MANPNATRHDERMPQSSVMESMSEGAGKFKNRIVDIAHKTEDLATNVRDQIGTTLEKAPEFIKKYPFRSIAVGFTAGVLIGFLVNRSRSV